MKVQVNIKELVEYFVINNRAKYGKDFNPAANKIVFSKDDKELSEQLAYKDGFDTINFEI